jgi:hypothetical protein
MPVLTTTEGHQITFVARAIAALADHDAVTGEAVTCVYGITIGLLKTAETVQAFMARLEIAQNFAQLTRPNGSPIWINGAAVSSIRAPRPSEYVAGVSTVVSAGAMSFGVKEAANEATGLINAHGGEL